MKSIRLIDPDRKILESGTETDLAVYDMLNGWNKPERLTYGNGVEVDWKHGEAGIMTGQRASCGDQFVKIVLTADSIRNLTPEGKNVILLLAISDTAAARMMLQSKIKRPQTPI